MAFVLPVRPAAPAPRVRVAPGCAASPFIAPPVAARRPAAARHDRRRAVPRACAPGAGIYAPDTAPGDVRVVVFGATGYIGRYVVREFAARGYRVVAFARERSGVGGKDDAAAVRAALGGGVRVVLGDVTDAESVAAAFAAGGDAGARAPVATVVVSCLASRTGGIADSNRIDYAATLSVLQAARAAGAGHFVLLSAICVQKPLLAFQRAKLRFEAELAAAADADPSFSYSIVRPTAFFKSLAAQVGRMRGGGSYIMFGDGALSRCNALSEADLARFMALAASDADKRNRVLPVGGPGAPATPREQADMVFDALGTAPARRRYTRVPIGLMDAAIGALAGLSRLVPPLADAAEFGRIGRYYATEDMVGPPFGRDTLEDFFAAAVADGGMDGQDLGDAKYF
jgi:divinyl chlorophyllide a 8-vinyl-reductase